MCKSSKQISQFTIEGTVAGILVEDGYKLKYLRITVASGTEYLVKVAKELRGSLASVLVPGLGVRVAGEKKLNLKNGTMKLKAYTVVPVAQAVTAGLPCPSSCEGQASHLPFLCPESSQSQERIEGEVRPGTSSKTQAKILVCQKSDCQKRGGAAVCQALQTALCERGLEDRVCIQGTGCLKQCKAGPNIVLMPDKTRYSRIEPADIPALIEKHFATTHIPG